MSTNMSMTVLDFYVADVTADANGGVPTYGTPRVIGGSAQVQVAHNKSTNKVYESGRAVYNKSHVADTKVTLSSHTVSLAEKKKLFFGITTPLNSVYEEGGDTDSPKNVAIGWPVLLDNGTYLCTWFYDASAEPSDENYTTSNESGPQIAPDSIVFNCVKRPGDRMIRRSKICADATAMAAFFASVTA